MARLLRPRLRWLVFGHRRPIELLIGLQAFPASALGPSLLEQVLVLLAHPRYLIRYHVLATLRRLYHLPEPADLQTDPLFNLLRSDGHPGRYQQAQALLRAQLFPAAQAAPS